MLECRGKGCLWSILLQESVSRSYAPPGWVSPRTYGYGMESATESGRSALVSLLSLPAKILLLSLARTLPNPASLTTTVIGLSPATSPFLSEYAHRSPSLLPHTSIAGLTLHISPRCGFSGPVPRRQPRTPALRPSQILASLDASNQQPLAVARNLGIWVTDARHQSELLLVRSCGHQLPVHCGAVLGKAVRWPL